ncbi:exonuclease [Actinoplanes sp. NPDC026619]|uniref:exonuclease n=1 Tax=Actinoplanes sp. NPDC026619 TaxID=3155798 RepID=UPI00340456FF
MARPEIYVSTDVETDGPIPGPHSMLSFASAAFTAEKELLGTFSANLVTLPGAEGAPETMAWWATQPQAWAACRADQQEPATAMVAYREWVTSLPGKPVFVGYPVAFDFMFVYWYLIRFAGSSPFSHSALDMKTYAMALLGTDYRSTVKRTMPPEWFDESPHSHVALDDALEQGALFVAMLAANPKTRKAEGGPHADRAGGPAR